MSDGTDSELRALRESLRQQAATTEKLTVEIAQLNETVRRLMRLLDQVTDGGHALRTA